jgi:hypothetical protein
LQEGVIEGRSPSYYFFPFPSGGFVSKVVIPVKTGIQFYMIRHDFWIPTCVGMTKRLEKGTYNTSLPLGKGTKGMGPAPPDRQGYYK